MISLQRRIHSVKALLVSLSLLVGLALVVGGAAPALAEDDNPRGAPSAVSETRLGVMAHDVPIFSGNDEDGVNVNAEILFTSPDFLKWILAPRPHIGGSFNTAGDTSQAYLGLTWDFDLTDSIFFEFSFGGAVHNGELDDDKMDRKALGCRVLFRESAALGWRFNEHHSLSVMLDHISNASLCDDNEGLDTLGVRYGYRF